MIYKAQLSREEVISFTSDFYELEIARMSEVRIVSDELHFQVMICSQSPEAELLLLKSFDGGMLHSKGWDEKFEEA